MIDDTSIEARFEGNEIIESGVAQIPNMLLWHYCDLRMSDGQYTLLSHIIARKWTREAPYPTLTGIKMSTNVDTRRRYVRDLRQKGLLFTTRMYWTAKDLMKNPLAKPGKVRSNLWYLSSLLHNLVRVHKWLESGKPIEEFQVEIPLVTVKMFLNGEFHDTPEYIAQAIIEQTQNGVVLKSILLPCEKRIVEKSSMRNSSSRNSSSRKTHSLKEETDSKKNQKSNKKQSKGTATPSTPKVEPPKAVDVYRSIAKRYPDKSLWDDITQIVGDSPEKLDFWGKVVKAYIGCGWNKLNVNGMLAFFRRGQIPTTEPVSKSTPTRNSTQSHQPKQSALDNIDREAYKKTHEESQRGVYKGDNYATRNQGKPPTDPD